VVDVIPFEAAHAKQLLGLDTGALIAISSASVYADDQGRTLDEAEGVDDFPELPVPIPETQATVEPGDGTYSTKKVALERILLENGEVPAAIVRPCAIYGRGDRMGREWHFVKRALDDRPHVILTSSGAGRFHTTASENIGELVRLLAAQPARSGAYNCGDPDPPSVLEIARASAAAAGHSFDEADALPRQVEWLIAATRGRDWREVLTRGANYLRFDYEAEDAFLAARSSATDGSA
jgi:nucleoside-diphosphate-sugar epimerase